MFGDLDWSLNASRGFVSISRVSYCSNIDACLLNVVCFSRVSCFIGIYVHWHIFFSLCWWQLSIPIFDVMRKRALLFAIKCTNSSSDTVQYVATYAVYHCRMASILESNVLFGCERFPSCLWISLMDILAVVLLMAYVCSRERFEIVQSCSDLSCQCLNDEYCIPDCVYTYKAIDDVIRSLCNSWFYNCLVI